MQRASVHRRSQDIGASLPKMKDEEVYAEQNDLRDVQTRKEAQLISMKMQLDVVGRQIEGADKKRDNAKVEELEMKEEKLSTMMATIMDPTPQKEVRPRSWNTLVV
jgi:hypothetical protein